MIVAAAIRVRQLVLVLERPNRHSDIYKWAECLKVNILDNKAECGFITSDGKFLDRSDAYKHAVESNQIEHKGTEVLISEDLW